jgi:phosphate transport system protein
MTHLEQVLKDLQNNVQEMAILVQKQLIQSKIALFTFDKALAQKVISAEKEVNEMDLKIDQSCENIVALYNPVAKDMRMVFAYYKINSHLERMGDYAKNIAYNVLELEQPIEDRLLTMLKFSRMFEIANDMILENIVALSSSQPQSAHSVFEMDKELNELHNNGISLVAEEIKKNPKDAKILLDLFTIARRIERVGDYNTNIAEEIIFCFEALVLKHSKKK